MKKQNGITLIALIITIIVMLILVGVTINVAINGGLLTTAQKAATEMSKAQIQERAEIVKITLMADLQSGDDSIMGLKTEYMGRLETEFGKEKVTISGNKVIVEGKYDIIVKNSDLDIEVREHSDYVDKSSIVSIMSSNANDIVIDNKTCAKNIQLNLISNIDEDAYALQEFEKNLENKEEPTDEEKKEAVLELMSQEVSEVKDTETTIESTDEYFVELFNYMANEYNIATHDTLDSWFEDENFPQGIELFFDLEEGMGEKIKTRSDLYNLYMGNTDLTVEVTEGQFIEYIYTNEIQAQQENEERSTYVEEYNNNTKNLNLYVMYNGEREDIAQGIDVESTQEYFINENGEYIFIVEDSEGKEISSETVIIRNVEKSPYILSEREAENLWETDENGTITRYLGDEISVIVPMYIGQQQITAISTALAGKSSIQSIDIPKTINTIKESAFSLCTSLKEISIAGEVTEIKDGTFASCVSLKKIELPDTVETIGRNAFYNCNSLEEIDIPNSVTTISGGAFERCSNLKEIVLPDSITTIQGTTFKECSALEGIEIPELVTTIGQEAFRKCVALKEIKIPNSVTEIQARAFRECSALEGIEISELVITIGQEAFQECVSLKEIEIPNSVTSIGEYAFKGCESLANVKLSENITEIQQYTFNGCSLLKEIEIPNSVIKIGQKAFTGCRAIENVKLSDHLEFLGYNSFSDCTTLTEITIPNSVTQVLSPFARCTDLSIIYFKKGVNSIPTGEWGKTVDVVEID